MYAYKKIYGFCILLIFSVEATNSSRIVRQINSNRGIKAAQMCQKYTRQACSGNFRFKNISTGCGTMECIVGGKIAQPKEYPHMAIIEGNSVCGASLISDSFLVTAAHCIHSKLRNVRLGDLNKENSHNASVVVAKVLRTYVHPHYERSGVNDIALIRIEKLTRFTDSIRPICLNVLEHIPNQKLEVTGWGAIYTDGPLSPKLKVVSLDLINGGCNYYETYDPKIMICAGYLPGGKDSCQGDSGGPLQLLTTPSGCSVPIYKQVGIVSSGEGCAQKNMPGLYTRISHYIPWIERIVWK